MATEQRNRDVYRGGELGLRSGCITTVSPMKNQAGWDLSIGFIDPRCTPSHGISFLAPTSMSRYEGVLQNGTSMMLKHDGKLTINCGKNTNPMVLHFSGLACVLANEDPIPIPVAEYEMKADRKAKLMEGLVVRTMPASTV